jgi:DNA-binding NtrC family response regulator
MKIQPQKPRILIVDDEFHSRQILRTSAEELGYEVVDTASPEEAKRLARFEAFDILITDLKMPTMDGIQLLESIRLHDPQLSVVVVTAHGSIETAVDAMKKGAEDYLLKPIELPVFELMLQRIQSKRALIRENIVLRSENSALKKDLQIRYHLNSLIGRSES